MEKADEISWFGDSKERFLERAAALDQWGKDNNKSQVGTTFVQEVVSSVNQISANANIFAERNNGERVATLHKSNFILVYKKEYFQNSQSGQKKLRILILDIRKSY